MTKKTEQKDNLIKLIKTINNADTILNTAKSTNGSLEFAKLEALLNKQKQIAFSMSQDIKIGNFNDLDQKIDSINKISHILKSESKKLLANQ